MPLPPERVVNLVFKNGVNLQAKASREHAKLLESVFKSHLSGKAKSHLTEVTLANGSMVLDMNELSGILNLQNPER